MARRPTSRRSRPVRRQDRTPPDFAVGARDELRAYGPRAGEPFPPEAEMSAEDEEKLNRAIASRAIDDPLEAVPAGEPERLSPAELSALRPHVINLRQGDFSDEGRFTTSAADVDSIFADALPRWIASRGKGPHRVVFWAHGGLVSEGAGLARAADLREWWCDNGVYPIFFVWETGFLETIGQLLEGVADQVPTLRAHPDDTTDRLVEFAARALGGPLVWGGMKRSAERAFRAEGGGFHTLQRVRDAVQVLRRRGQELDLHLVGHSAGSIFLAHLLPAAAEIGLPDFATLSLLAPAITVERYRDLVQPRVGTQVRKLAMFAMRRDLERADTCLGLYRKSLLYLIHRALEARRHEPILGLEESVTGDPALAEHFRIGRWAALDPPGRDGADVVWAVTTEKGSGRPDTASGATTHGGFHRDPATMNSVLRRILGPRAAVKRLFTTEEPARDADPMRAVDARIQVEADRLGLRTRERPHGHVNLPTAADAPASTRLGAAPSARRRALCIGINDYADAPLLSCVADAELWAATLGQLGFEVEPLLLDAAATGDAIVSAMRRLVTSAGPGDLVVVQYAGHGTTLPDVSGDEAGGDTPDHDEALVPADYESGRFIVDDELAQVWREIPAGVSVVCFFDCCHSGTVNRVAAAGARQRDAEARVRRFEPAPELIELYLASRRKALAARAGGRARPPAAEETPEISFAACRSGEKAMEAGGHGLFTASAVEVIRQGVAGVTNAAFIRRVVDGLGSAPTQHPELNCAPGREHLPFLRGAHAATAGAPDARRSELLARIRELLEEIE